MFSRLFGSGAKEVLEFYDLDSKDSYAFLVDEKTVKESLDKLRYFILRFDQEAPLAKIRPFVNRLKLASLLASFDLSPLGS